MSGVSFRMSDEDMAMVDSLVRSPVFGALKRLIRQHTEQAQGLLMSSDDHNAMLRLQGRIQGLHVIETLPELIVMQNDAKNKQKADAENVKNKTLETQRKDYETYAQKMAEERQKKTDDPRFVP